MKFHEMFEKAANSGDIDPVKILLDKGVNVYFDNDYTLRYASARGFSHVRFTEI